MNNREDIIRLILADDYPVTRAGIRRLLSQATDIEIIGEAGDGLEAQRLTFELHPHVLLLGLQMPGPRPYEVAEWVFTNCPETNVLVFTAHDRNVYLADMIDAGAVGFLKKDGATAQNLIEAIRRAVRGEMLFDPEQVQRARQWRETIGAKWNSLTAREREVLMLVAQGKTDQEIADNLQIKVKTAGHHLSRILGKLEVASRTEAAVWAINESFADKSSGV
jgi:two-component system, NarL family, response regulator LiaR